MSNLLYLAIGSNLGNRVGHLHRAWHALSRHGKVTNSSFLYHSAPMYYSAQDSFLNGVLEYRTDLEAEQALDFFQGIERELGREYLVSKGPRCIDLDILLFNQEVLNTPRLQVPHQDMLERDFVVTPLLDINPALLHPSLGMPIGQAACLQHSNALKRVLALDILGQEVLFQLDDYKAYSMGIVNVSPDSFHSSQHLSSAASLSEYSQHFDVLDIGGESSRPGSQLIAAEQEIERLSSVLLSPLAQHKVLSLDTRKAEVARYFQHSFHIINDVSGSSQSADMVSFAAQSLKPMVMTHNLDGNNNTIQDSPANSPAQVATYFQTQRDHLLSQGIPRWNLIFDIGLGFNKSLNNNMALIKAFPELREGLQNMPSLIGFSNKSSFGKALGGEQERANQVMAALSFCQKTTFMRLHDPEVAATLECLNKHFA